MLDLTLLGTTTVTVDGEALDVDTRKAVAVLAHVAITGPQARDVLAALLWPTSDDRRARAALRRTLSVLRRALDGRWLETTNDVVGITGDWRCDVVQMRAHMASVATHPHRSDRPCPDCLPDLQAAVDLVGGELLSGFRLRDAAPFELWVSQEAEAVRRDHRRALGLLVQGLTVGGRLDDALVHARAQVDLDALQEPAQRRLMLLLAWTGRRTAAVRQYESLAATLDAELGVPPTAETAALAAAIREDRAPSPPRSQDRADFAAASRQASHRTDAGEDRSGPAAWSDRLVGRDRELASLVEAARASPPGTGAVLALHGEAGAGKTRLASELLATLSDDGAATIAVRCHPGDVHVPYAPVVEALRVADRLLDGTGGDLDDHWRVEAARLVPKLAGQHTGDSVPLESPGALARFVEGVWRTLAAALEGHAPGVLFVDDLHHADAATLDLLAYGASRVDRLPVIILLSWRSGDLADPDVVTKMQHEAAVVGAATASVELGRLDRDAVAALASDAVGDVAPELVDRLVDETEGLALAVVAYLEAAAAGDRAEEWSLPPSLAALYRRRLAELAEVPHQVLTAAATIGRSFDLDTLIGASGRTDEEVVTAIEVLVARGMIAETGRAPDAFDFTHDKLRTTVHGETSLARRRLLHRRIATALQQGATTDPAAAAFHEERAGRDARAAALHVRAAEQAMALFANADALQHLARAKALGHPDGLALNEAIGDLLTLSGSYREALASYDTAAAFADGPSDRARLDHKAGGVHLRAGDPTSALARLTGAAAGAGVDEVALRARITADRALAQARTGDVEAAEECARSALALAEDTADQRAIAQARNILGVIARRRGETSTARRHLEISADLAARLDDPSGEVAALNNLALALHDGGELEHATDHARRALELCVGMGDRHRAAALHSNLADLLHAAGSDEDARTHLTESAAMFAAVGAEPEREPELWRLTDW